MAFVDRRDPPQPQPPSVPAPTVSSDIHPLMLFDPLEGRQRLSGRHDEPSTSSADPSPSSAASPPGGPDDERVCRFFQAGTCSKGVECPDSHVTAEGKCPLCGDEVMSVDSDDGSPPDGAVNEAVMKHLQQCREYQMLEADKALSGEMTCVICMEKLATFEPRLALLPICGHFFCMDCIFTWRRKSDVDSAHVDEEGEAPLAFSCPVCRTHNGFIVPVTRCIVGEDRKRRLVEKHLASKKKILCPDFKRTGTCRYGRRCVYRHERNGREVPPEEQIDPVVEHANRLARRRMMQQEEIFMPANDMANFRDLLEGFPSESLMRRLGLNVEAYDYEEEEDDADGVVSGPDPSDIDPDHPNFDPAHLEAVIERRAQRRSRRQSARRDGQADRRHGLQRRHMLYITRLRGQQETRDTRDTRDSRLFQWHEVGDRPNPSSIHHRGPPPRHDDDDDDDWGPPDVPRAYSPAVVPPVERRRPSPPGWGDDDDEDDWGSPPSPPPRQRPPTRMEERRPSTRGMDDRRRDNRRERDLFPEDEVDRRPGRRVAPPGERVGHRQAGRLDGWGNRHAGDWDRRPSERPGDRRLQDAGHTPVPMRRGRRDNDTGAASSESEW